MPIWVIVIVLLLIHQYVIGKHYWFSLGPLFGWKTKLARNDHGKRVLRVLTFQETPDIYVRGKREEWKREAVETLEQPGRHLEQKASLLLRSQRPTFDVNWVVLPFHRHPPHQPSRQRRWQQQRPQQQRHLAMVVVPPKPLGELANWLCSKKIKSNNSSSRNNYKMVMVVQVLPRAVLQHGASRHPFRDFLQWQDQSMRIRLHRHHHHHNNRQHRRRHESNNRHHQHLRRDLHGVYHWVAMLDFLHNAPNQ